MNMCRPPTPDAIVQKLRKSARDVAATAYTTTDAAPFRGAAGRGLHAGKYSFLRGGTAAANEIVSRARWAGPARECGPALDSKLQPDVLVVDGLVSPEHRALKMQSKAYLAGNLRDKWHWPVVSRTTLVVTPATNVADDGWTIVALFVTAARDPAIAQAFRHVDDVWTTIKAKGARVATSRKVPSSKLPGRGHEGPSAQRPMCMDGICKNKFRTGLSYFTRPTPYTPSELLAHCWHYTNFAALERKHVPGMAAFRRREAEQVHFPGCFPGVPLSLMSACCISLTQNYACDAHADSAKPGMSETVGFKGEGPRDWMFAITEIGVLFDLKSAQKGVNGGCVIYFPGTIHHGTPPTGVPHTGYGFALISKAVHLGPAAETFFRRHARDLIRAAPTGSTNPTNLPARGANKA